MRKPFYRNMALGLILVFLASLVAGCGSTQSNANNQSAKDLARIKSVGKLTFAMSGKYPPFNYFNDQNQLTGFDVEIGQEIARRIGVKPAPVATDWDGIIAGLLAKKYDMILGSMAITPARLAKVNFSDPYYRSGAQIIVPNDSTVTGGSDLKGKRVGVVLGETYEKVAGQLGANVKTYKGEPAEFEDMLNGRLDAIITDKIVGLNAIKKNNYPFKLVGSLLYTEKMGIAIRKDDPDLLKAVNKALAGMMADGTYAKISQKYFNADIR